jgi:hypothetical protein
MQKSKIIAVFKQLDSRTITRFGEYVSSPYFNKHQATTSLCLYLLKEAPTFKKEAKLKKERIFKNIFPKELFDNKKFHRLSSQLLQLLHNFLIDDAWQGKKDKRTIVLLEELRKLKLEKHHSIIQKQYKQQASSIKLNHSAYHESQYKFYKELDKLFIEQGGRAYNENLQLANDSLDYCFILEKLKIACDMASRNKVVNANYQWSIMENIETYLENPTDTFPPIIQIFYTIFKMLTSEESQSEKSYQKFKCLLEQHASGFTKEDIMQTYGYALNYTIGQINKKGAIYWSETFDFYVYLVDSEAILVDGRIPQDEYKNIVTVAVRLEKYAWAENFIQKYRKKLPLDIQNDVYKYNLASLQHSKQDYSSALKTLENVDFINPTYYLGTKIIQLKIFYALNDTEALYSLIDACKSYLHRSKTVSDYQKKATSNLFKFTKKLYKIKDEQELLPKEKTITYLEKLKTTIQDCKFVANRDWINNSLKKIPL